jgi:predicted outer membrane protein
VDSTVRNHPQRGRVVEQEGRWREQMTGFSSTAAAVLLLALVLTASGYAAEKQDTAGGSAPVTPSALPSAETQDRDFMKTAPGLLLPEIEISKLGAEKATDPQVATLSRKMVDEYTRLARELEDAARSAGLEMPGTPDPHGVNRLQRLEDSGPQFDLAWLAEQKGLHKKLIAIYSMEERAGKNQELQKHAEEGRDLLATNLVAIQQIRTRSEQKRTTPG